MEKLIELHQEDTIVCDTPHCDFRVKNTSGYPHEDIIAYLNMSCPICGQNLLTADDYYQYLKTLRFIDWINKWFGWINYFTPPWLKKNSEKTSKWVKVHKGVQITDTKPYK